MDPNLAQPCEESICHENSQGSNVAPNNPDVMAKHDVNCKDEDSEVIETTQKKNVTEQQSNDGDGAGFMMETG